MAKYINICILHKKIMYNNMLPIVFSIILVTMPTFCNNTKNKQKNKFIKKPRIVKKQN